jgi:hypothetical protein
LTDIHADHGVGDGVGHAQGRGLDRDRIEDRPPHGPGQQGEQVLGREAQVDRRGDFIIHL